MLVDRNQVPFTDLEYDQLSYLLDMLRNDLRSGMKVVERLQPLCRHLERMKVDAQAVDEFIARIESR